MQNNISYQFNLMSHDYRALQAAITLYKESFKTHNLNLNGPIYLPKKEKSIVLLRSPHVNKASREVFKFKQYKTILILTLNENKLKILSENVKYERSKSTYLEQKKSNTGFIDNNALDLFLKRMCLLDIAGVSIQIKKKL